MQSRTRKRLQLVMLGALFVLPVALAFVLASSGWVPGAKSFGVGIVPQRSVEKVNVELANGTRLDWHDPDWRWSLVAIPGKHCAQACMTQLDLLHRARISLNQNSGRVRLLFLGTPPAGPEADQIMPMWQVGSDVGNGFAEWVPAIDDGLAVVLVKPNGVALTYYATGFDASGLRKDLAKVTK